MNRLGRIASLVLLLCALACGGGDSGLSGSQCDLIDCSYDKIACRLYAPPNEALMVYYKRQLETGGDEYAAIISIDLDGAPEDLAGWRFEGGDFNDRVRIYRPESNNWPSFDGNMCEFANGGAVGSSLDGKCAFRFDNGRFATASFSCELEAAEQ
ncbi:MAG: hypothetical protein JXR96_28525 [Deltaproteobacteria bacterium]|nr:hypothetical protein [Deltaproteobacteria bacterium]